MISRFSYFYVWQSCLWLSGAVWTFLMIPDACLWLNPPRLNCFLSLGLAVCVLSILFFVSSQYVYLFECSPVMIQKASAQAEHNLCFFYSRLLGEDFAIKIDLSPRPIPVISAVVRSNTGALLLLIHCLLFPQNTNKQTRTKA